MSKEVRLMVSTEDRNKNLPLSPHLIRPRSLPTEKRDLDQVRTSKGTHAGKLPRLLGFQAVCDVLSMSPRGLTPIRDQRRSLNHNSMKSPMSWSYPGYSLCWTIFPTHFMFYSSDLTPSWQGRLMMASLPFDPKHATQIPIWVFTSVFMVPNACRNYRGRSGPDPGTGR